MKPYLLKLITVLSISAILLTSCSGDESSESNSSGTQNNTDNSSEYILDMPPNGVPGNPDMPMDPNNNPGNFFENDQSGINSSDSSSAITYVNPNYAVSYKETDLTTDYDESASTIISCNGTDATVKGEGADVTSGVITITKSGIYVLSGDLTGRIIVNSTDTEPVRLVLKGISVTCTTSAPLYVAAADKVVITLAEGTSNSFKDGTTYTYDDVTNEEPSAAIFSKDDLTFNGEGSLTVDASFKNGIQCKDKLKICGGTITVNSKNDGLKGKDCVGICGGKITITSQGDGIQATNTDAEDVGFVNIGGGTLNITSALDGIQGENGICISDGTITINSGNGSSSSTDSKKGLKGVKDVTVVGGKISITSSDDAVHSDGIITIEGGEITASSGDDGFHAEISINIKNGTVNITRSYEGLEAAKINISGGNVTVKASDDGVNASDGTGSKGGMGGGMMANSNCEFNVSGGFVYVNASGDGLDSNGNISVSGGVVICEGPTNGGNSSVDHNGSISVTGGTLFSIGSNGMAGEILSSTTGTTQCIFGSYCNGSAGTTVGIKDSSGKVLFVFKTSKQFGHLLFSSPDMKTGETYEIYVGGSGSGECINGLYTNCTYSGGSLLASVSQSATVTGGTGGMGGMGGMGGGMNPGGGRPSKPGRW